MFFPLYLNSLDPNYLDHTIEKSYPTKNLNSIFSINYFFGKKKTYVITLRFKARIFFIKT